MLLSLSSTLELALYFPQTDCAEFRVIFNQQYKRTRFAEDPRRNEAKSLFGVGKDVIITISDSGDYESKSATAITLLA